MLQALKQWMVGRFGNILQWYIDSYLQQAEDLYQEVGYIPRGDIATIDTIILYYGYRIIVMYNHHFSEGMKSVLPISLTRFVYTLSQPECNITCPDGFTVFDDCSGCELTDICLAETPCLNGGTCYLVRAPNDYRCDCPEATEGARCEGGMSW